jgi:TrmH RNA methyltransferase
VKNQKRDDRRGPAGQGRPRRPQDEHARRRIERRERGGSPADDRDRETFVCGLHAALAVLQRRPEAIRRVFHTAPRRLDVAPLLAVCVERRLPYNEVPPDVLETIVKTTHHGGVAVFIDPVPLVTLDAFVRTLPRGAVVLAVDGVGNPHNLGAILRTAAWFGVAGVVLPLEPNQARLSPAAMRVAEGGAEVVACVGVPSLEKALERLAAAGVTLVAAEAGSATSPFATPLPRPVCIVLGNEERGVRPPLRLLCKQTVSIPGTGAVESLNVSVAAGILVAAVTHGPRPLEKSQG